MSAEDVNLATDYLEAELVALAARLLPGFQPHSHQLQELETQILGRN